MTGAKIYAIIILFAAISSFNLGLFYLVQSIKNKSRVYMAIGTIIFSICLFFAFYELTDLVFKYPQLMWINGPLLFTIGPFFYLHVKRKVTWRAAVHFVPFLMIFFWILPFYVKSASEKIGIIKEFYAPLEKPELEIMQYLYVLHIGFYCLLGYLILRKKTTLFDSYDSNVLNYHLNARSRNLYLLIASLGILSFSVCLIADIFDVYYGIVDKFTFSLLVILVLLLQVYFSVKGYNEKMEIEFDNEQNENKVISDSFQIEEFNSLLIRTDELMKNENLYRDPDLKITEVAEKVGVSMHQLSAAINQQNGNNFFDYINKLRIEELKTTLLDDKKKNLTLFAIARESGFKSNSSFYRVFKKYVGKTPKQFIEQKKGIL